MLTLILEDEFDRDDNKYMDVDFLEDTDQKINLNGQYWETENVDINIWNEVVGIESVQ